ncbi:MAG: Plastocyanin [Parcubacteria group bacterium GW2011_GWA2_47_16]|nr:MAG: Plastocyanin [Parcubacteria group bacterium GW2011_GWA2_47_16]
MYPEPTTSNASKYVVGIIIIALVIIGVSLMGRDKKLSGTAKTTADKEVAGQTSAMPTIDAPDTIETIVTPSGKIVEINYTSENGFTPDNLSIKTGDTVKFINKSTEEMWVGSNDHPTHAVYAGTKLREHCPDTSGTAFDQCGKGNEYSFTFNKVGSWKYHNHTRAGMGGVIVAKE